jgi:hypothetical protein
VAALDDWAVCNRNDGQRRWLLQVAKQSDPDPTGWRDSIRDAQQSDDRAVLTELAGGVPLGLRLRNRNEQYRMFGQTNMGILGVAVTASAGAARREISRIEQCRLYPMKDRFALALGWRTSQRRGVPRPRAGSPCHFKRQLPPLNFASFPPLVILSRALAISG